MSDYIQYDSSETVVGGVNIAEAIETDKRLIFNESYTISGARLVASSVYACYDLTILGDMEVEDIEVRGNLYVTGDIKAKRLSCLKAIICSGKIKAKTIYGSEVIANDIKCDSISCSGNIVARTTIDIGESLKTEKAVMMGEGIVGNGLFSAQNAIAVEFFDFQGEVKGKVMELDTDTSFGAPHETPAAEDASIDMTISELKEKVLKELRKAGEIDEGRLVEFVGQLSSYDEVSLTDWKWLLDNLVELSYSDKITNLRDYLIVVMAKKVMPEEIRGYETIEHVFGEVIENAENHLDSLPFHAKDVADFAYALKIVGLCENELKIGREELLDRIFQSIGIKYKTVKSFLG